MSMTTETTSRKPSRDIALLYSAPMALATLADTKTQTRRMLSAKALAYIDQHQGFREPDNGKVCPYGQPGDRLWGRETFFAWGRWETRFSAKKGREEWHFVDMTLETGRQYVYAASGQPEGYRKAKRAGAAPAWWMRPAIFMPRVASRILMEVVSVRVERLQDISEADALAEGVVRFNGYACLPGMRPLPDHYAAGPGNVGVSAVEAYASLWRDINGHGSWDANPWVWVVAFRRI